MPFELSAFLARWPFAYHLTSRTNIEPIRHARRPEGASTLLVNAGRQELLRQKRKQHTRIRVNAMDVLL